jgi:endonuclease/exonuclease/phosphatase family metal-dependent hydrolase
MAGHLLINQPFSVRVPSLVVLLALASCVLAHAQLRIVDYNTSGSNSHAGVGLSTVLAAIGAEKVDGIAKPLDVISLQEQTSASTQSVVSVLNTLYGAGVYAATTLIGAGDTTQTIVYNTQTVQLVGQMEVGTSSSSGQARQALRAEFQLVGYDSSSDFYVYASHYKASDDSTSANRRNLEAQAIRANADALGAGQNIIYTGDFNIYRSTEAMWTTLTASGNGQAIDPFNKVGNWHGSPGSFLTALTQSPVSTARYSGQTTGGLDDRFDFQLVTSALMDNEGLSVLASSYHTFGNDGSVAVNGEITSANASALATRLGYTTTQASAVLTALSTVSDHLPVVADYQLPAMMNVTVGSAPSRIIVGASSKVAVTVSNTAPVVAANGADELDYTVSGSGAASGSFTGVDLALDGGQTHQLTLASNVVGTQNGGIIVHSPSQGVAHGDFSGTLTYAVLDHAKASFVGSADPLVLTLDFGTVAQFSSASPQTFSIANWLSALGGTAGLDLDAIESSSASGPFSSDLALFQALVAGTARDFHLSMATDAPGVFDETYTLLFSDENLPGATAVNSLTLHVTGQVAAVPEPGVIGLLAIGLGGICLRYRHGRQVSR